jgi:hypothetical protein
MNEEELKELSKILENERNELEKELEIESKAFQAFQDEMAANALQSSINREKRDAEKIKLQERVLARIQAEAQAQGANPKGEQKSAGPAISVEEKQK